SPHVRVGNCQASIRRTPYRKVRGFLLCAGRNMPDGGFDLSGMENPHARYALCHRARQTARSHGKEKQEYKEGIYKRRKAKTQP
ncbi:hypothetical protein, partial [Enterobacter cloacae complex sp. SHL020]|uniref:hypothetical protein n=1 Tax=Enterobacter cloacae complex sp. SHL020 TaxID=3412401 RepID=UPI003B9F3EB2